ncbi:MAG: hypothetical protein JSR29_04820 [Nitrospira sp.]|nr:hypothetical protein [Nitrospira sp.]
MPDEDNTRLRIEALHERHSGLTPSLSGSLYEAASVCLSRHHSSPVEIDIACNGGTSTRIVDFQGPDSRMLNAWANDIDTTEMGAYGVCLAVVEAEEQLVAVRRAETLTGADWYIAPVGTESNDLENCFRLEVSGVDAGDHAAIKGRLSKKLAQAGRGASNLPAIASVVGFKARAVAMQKVSSDK